MTAASRFEALAAGPDEGIGVSEAALLVAAEDAPGVDVARYLAVLDDLGRTLAGRLRPDISVTDTILTLNRYLFEELGFRGPSDNYYDPRNSFLNEVLDRRIGIPITLSIVYIDVGRKLGLPLAGVSFPGHFLVRCSLREGAVILDPFARGVSLSVEDLRRRLAALGVSQRPSDADIVALLAPASNREIVARLLRNLKAIYLRFRQLPQALAASSRILQLHPEFAPEWRDRAAIHLELECFRAALADYQRYVALAPDAEDADAVRGRMVDLQQRAARLN